MAACVTVVVPTATLSIPSPSSDVWASRCDAIGPFTAYYQVEQTSMENTLLPDDLLVLDTSKARSGPYQRGDTVVFMPPDAASDSVPYNKRVIGVGSDTIDIRESHVFVNGQELTEPYVYPGQATEPLVAGEDHFVIPKGSLFVLGDHRQDSQDSRIFGPISESSVIGRAWLRYWPLNTLTVLATPTYPDLSPLHLPAPVPSSQAGDPGRSARTILTRLARAA